MSAETTVPGAPPATRSRNAALTGIGQMFVLVGASAIGVIVAARLTNNARLDAYFTANQVSVAALYVGQAVRTSVPGLQVSGVVRAAVLTRAAFVMTAVSAAVLLLALAAGPFLLPADSRGAFRTDLAILLPGAVLQVMAGYAAGRLAILGRFAGVALAYAVGTFLNAALLVVLVDAHGAGVLAPAALGGWVLSASVIAWLLWRAARAPVASGADHGVPVEQTIGPPVALVGEVAASHEAPTAQTRAASTVGVLGASGRIVLSVLPVLSAQLVVVAGVTAAASLRSGGSTLMSFAFLAINAVGTVAVAPIPIVLSSDFGSTWDRDPRSLTPLIHSIVRLSMAVTMPLALILFLVGRPIAEAKLAGLGTADVGQLFELCAVLLPSLPLTAAGMVGVVAVVTLDRLGRLARGLALAAAGTAITIIVITTLDGSLLVLAIASGFWAAVLGCVPLALVLGRRAPGAIWGVVRDAFLVAGPSAVVLVAGAVIGGSLLSGLLLAVLGGCVHLLWLRLRFAPELSTLLGAVLRRG